MRVLHLKTITILPDLSYESALWERGIQYIAGVDEAGRGALAGPVAAGVVVLPAQMGLGEELSGVRDSKQMTPRAREFWAQKINLLAISYSVGFSSNDEVDEIGIVPATKLAIQRAIKKLSVTPQHLLIDYLKCPELQIPQTCLVKGDARCLSIAAASVLAKTARDALLRRLANQYPGYELAKNKGYGTQAHRKAISLLGRSAIHRKSFMLKAEKV